jgi:uncharacterized protein with FMN-binding domain
MPIIVLIIGVVIALGLGGYFWGSGRTETTDAEPAAIETAVAPVIPAPTPTTNEPAPVTAEPTTPVTPESTFKDGSYTAKVSYLAPDTKNHDVTVTLTVQNDIVTDSTLVFGVSEGPTANYQSRFTAEYKTLVVGKSLSDIKLSRVSGASLTTNAWNSAQADINTQAQS